MGFKTDRSRISLFDFGRFCLKFFELLGPEMRRGVTNLVGTHQRADFGQAILRAEIRIRVSASEGLRFAVQRMQRRVKGGGVFHSVIRDFITAQEISGDDSKMLLLGTR